MKKIAIIFLTDQWNESYSLTSVVKSQIRSLVARGYYPKVLTFQGALPWLFKNKVEYLSCIPKVKYDFKKDRINRPFYKSVRKISTAFKKNLKNTDVVFAHDVLFLGMFLPYNLALRGAAKDLKNIRWFHWCHSGPSKPKKLAYPRSLLYKGMPNAKFVSVTKAHRKGFARMYSVAPTKIVTVYNPRVNQDFLNLHPLTWKIIKKTFLLAADIVNLTATTISRAHKQPEICLYIMAALKNEGKSVRLILANSFAKRGKKEQANILHLRWLAEKIGLTKDEVFFTSDLDPSLANCCPPEIIKDLFSLSNIYIHPSLGEACSLTLLEAGITKHLCILNSELPSFREIVGDNAIWVKFENLTGVLKKRYKIKGSSIKALKYYYIHYLENKSYYRRLARRIIKQLEKDKTLSLFARIKREFNEDVIFETQIKPLLEDRC